MAYKMVVDVGKLCASLVGSAIEHRDRITAAMTEMWSSRLPEGQVLDLPTMLTCIAEDLREVHTRLTLDSRRVDADLSEARKGRLTRDGSLVETREALFAARKVLDAIFGAGGADAVFMKPNSQVEIDPAMVFEQATVVADNLTNPDFVLPELRVDVGVDLPAVAESIRGPARQLGEALEELSLVNPKSHASLEAKDRSFGMLSRKAMQGARLLEAIFAYAGHEGIASRTRRSKHRPQRTGDAPQATEGGPPADQAAEGPAAAATPPAATPPSAAAPQATAQTAAPQARTLAEPDIPPASRGQTASAEPPAAESATTEALPEKEGNP